MNEADRAAIAEAEMELEQLLERTPDDFDYDDVEVAFLDDQYTGAALLAKATSIPVLDAWRLLCRLYGDTPPPSTGCLLNLPGVTHESLVQMASDIQQKGSIPVRGPDGKKVADNRVLKAEVVFLPGTTTPALELVLEGSVIAVEKIGCSGVSFGVVDTPEQTGGQPCHEAEPPAPSSQD